MLSRPQIRALLDDHGLAPRRSLGQNFVADPNTVRRVVRLAGVSSGDAVLEVGAGLGSLTLALVETGAAVTAIETDPGLVAVLNQTVGDRATVVEADAMTVNWPELLGSSPSWSLVANLPYNVATPVILDVLEQAPEVTQMVVMVQKEVAQRLAAPAGSAAYGIPSVVLAYRATARVVGAVSREVFYPRPRVDSALVHVVRLDRPSTDADPKRLFELVRAGFGQRRKMLRRSLADRVSEDAFADAGVDPRARPGELDVQDWGRLAAAVDRAP